jgi:hypothetical protein
MGATEDKKKRMKDVTGTGALKDPKPWRYDLIPPEVEHKLAVHYGRGTAAGYESRNWEKGQLFSTYYSSARSHMGAFWGGENEDPDDATALTPEDRAHHLDAAIWQLVCLRSHTLNPELVERASLDDRPK